MAGRGRRLLPLVQAVAALGFVGAAVSLAWGLGTRGATYGRSGAFLAAALLGLSTGVFLVASALKTSNGTVPSWIVPRIWRR